MDFVYFNGLKKTVALGLVVFMSVAGFPAHALIPNDTHLNEQWYLEKIGAYDAWENTTGEGDVTVAVLDSGIDLDHPDLKDNIWTNPGEVPGDGIDNDGNGYVDDVNGWDFVEDDNSPIPDLEESPGKEAASHGTAIAGVIGAQGNNGQGTAGITWDVNVMPVRILNNLGSGQSDNARKALRYAVEQGADIVNLSFVGFQLDSQFRQVIEDANRAGVLIVAAVGNQGEGGLDINEKPVFPACFRANDQSDTVIGVAATTHEDKKAAFSNYGSNCTDISAPGEGIFGLSYHQPEREGFEEPYSGYWDGTSIASPIIAGSAALLLGAYSDATPRQVKEILQLSVDPVVRTEGYESGDLGSGRVNIARAFEIAERVITRAGQSSSTASGADASRRVVIAGSDAGATPAVRVFSPTGEPRTTFLAYNRAFRGGVRSAFGDVDGDGVNEIVTVPGVGGGPHVRVFETDGALRSQFFADRPEMTSGLFVATGDVMGDTADEIIVSTGANGEGDLKVFSYDGRELASFRPFGPVAYAVHVAAGDVDRDGRDEIVVAPGAGESPRVRVFEGAGILKHEFPAYGEGFTGGVYVAAGDVDEDPADEIIVGPGAGMEPTVRVYTRTGVKKSEFSAYATQFQGGVRVASGHLNGKLANIITAAGPGGGPHVRVFNSTGNVLGNFFADAPSLRAGLFVAGE